MSYGAPVYAGPTPAAGGAAGADAIASVEIAFTSAPGDANPVWVDVTGYLQAASTNRGRQNELDQFQAGSMTVTLDNRLRTFDPSYASNISPGNVLPMKRIRLRATYAGVTYPVFDGFIDSWTQEYDPPNNARAVVQATDGFKVLAAYDLRSSAYTQGVFDEAPLYWFRLGDAVGSTAAVDQQFAAQASVVGTASFQQPGLAGDGDGAYKAGDANSGLSCTDSRLFLTGSLSAFSVECLIKTTETSTDVIWQQDGDSSAQLRLRMLASGVLEFQITDTGSAYTAETESTGAVNDGTVKHIVATFSTTNGLRVYVNGSNDSNVVLTDTGTPNMNANRISIGNDKAMVVNGWLGTLDEVAVYNRELSSTEVSQHSSDALSPWTNDGSGQRVNRVLDILPWNIGREIDTGVAVLQSVDLGVTVLDHLQRVSATEFGELFMTRDGSVRFDGRDQLVNQDNHGTYTDSATYRIVMPALADQLIRNDVTISRDDGTAQNVKDATSIAAFLTHSYVRDGLLHTSDAVSRTAAEWILSLYKNPTQRLESLNITPKGNPSVLFPQILGRELTDRITVEVTPQGLGAVSSDDYVIQGISHSVSPKRWETTFRLAAAIPAGGAEVCVFELDDSSGSAPCGLGSTDTDGPALHF